MNKDTIKQRVRLKELSDKLNVINRLNGYTKMIHLAEVNPNIKKATLTILALDSNKKYAHITWHDSLISAQTEYLELETKHMDNNNINVLMLKMNDLKQIKESYPNYFADSKKFINALQVILLMERLNNITK